MHSMYRRHRQARLKWAREHVRCTRQNWRFVLFRDEVKFCLDFTDKLWESLEKTREKGFRIQLLLSTTATEVAQVWRVTASAGMDGQTWLCFERSSLKSYGAISLWRSGKRSPNFQFSLFSVLQWWSKIEEAVTPWRSGQRFLTFEEMVAGKAPEERCVNASERRLSSIVGALYSSPLAYKHPFTYPCVWTFRKRSNGAQWTSKGRLVRFSHTLRALGTVYPSLTSRKWVVHCKAND